MADNTGVDLGSTYRDQITGFQGVCTGVCYYISGCHQALLSPPVKKDGTSETSQWFDVQRLAICPAKKIVLDNRKTPGHDAPAPVR